MLFSCNNSSFWCFAPSSSSSSWISAFPCCALSRHYDWKNSVGFCCCACCWVILVTALCLVFIQGNIGHSGAGLRGDFSKNTRLGNTWTRIFKNAKPAKKTTREYMPLHRKTVMVPAKFACINMVQHLGQVLMIPVNAPYCRDASPGRRSWLRHHRRMWFSCFAKKGKDWLLGNSRSNP